jgi:hypothetical protein
MFEKGQSGNPAGKPKGAKDKRTELRELLRPHAPALVEKAVELALSGDLTALKLCLDRVMPPLKATPECVALPLPGESLLEKGETILTAVSEGRITPEESNHRLGALARYGGLVGKEFALERYRDSQDFNALFQKPCSGFKPSPRD